MSCVIWSQEAKLGLERIYHFLAARDKGLAKRALSAIYHGARLLDTRSLIGHPVQNKRVPGRELVLRFGHGGYVIRYVTENDHVVITAIWHTRQLSP